MCCCDCFHDIAILFCFLLWCFVCVLSRLVLGLVRGLTFFVVCLWVVWHCGCLGFCCIVAFRCFFKLLMCCGSSLCVWWRWLIFLLLCVHLMVFQCLWVFVQFLVWILSILFCCGLCSYDLWSWLILYFFFFFFYFFFFVLYVVSICK